MLLLAVVCMASLAHAKDRPFVSQIEGDKVIIVKTADGKNTTAGQGTELNVGDHLRTGPHTSAVIVYPDGSKIFLGRGTDVTLGENTGQSQFNELTYGQIRGLVKKPVVAQNPGAPPRFIVRSRAATMGVRGTDFVFGAAEGAGGAEVRTLEGVVEVAKSEPELLAGKGVAVTPGHFVNASEAALAPVRRFNREEYLAELEKSQPEVTQLVRNDPEASKLQPLASQALEDEPPQEKPRPRLKLLMFQVSAIASAQDFSIHRSIDNVSGALVSGEVTWNPTFRLLGPIHLRPYVGFAPLKEQDGSLFVAGRAGALLSFVFFDHLLVEGGPGLGQWFGHGHAGSEANINLGYKLGYDGFFERIFFGVTMFDMKKNSVTNSTGGYVDGGSSLVTTARAGLGFQF